MLVRPPELVFCIVIGGEAFDFALLDTRVLGGPLRLQNMIRRNRMSSVCGTYNGR
jgi:hypothetical protein